MHLTQLNVHFTKYFTEDVDKFKLASTQKLHHIWQLVNKNYSYLWEAGFSAVAVIKTK